MSAALDGVVLPPPDDGRLRLRRAAVSEEAMEVSAAYTDTGVIGTELADQIAIMRRRLAARTRNRSRPGT